MAKKDGDMGTAVGQATRAMESHLVYLFIVASKPHQSLVQPAASKGRG